MKNIHLLIFSLSYVIVLQLTSYTNNKTNSKEEKVLEKQLLRAHSISNEVTTIRYYPYDKEDLDVSIALLDSILKENKYALIDDFDSKVKAIFGNIKRYDNINVMILTRYYTMTMKGLSLIYISLSIKN